MACEVGTSVSAGTELSWLSFEPHRYRELLDDHVAAVKQTFATALSRRGVTPEVFASSPSHYRQRVRFSVARFDPDGSISAQGSASGRLKYALYDKGACVARPDIFPVAAESICELMPRLLAALETDSTLWQVQDRTLAEPLRQLEKALGATGERPRSASGLRALRKTLAAEELAQFDAYRARESAALARDRRVLERQAKALLKVPDRKERSEVDALKRELEAVRADGRAREVKWKMAASRLQKQVASGGRRACSPLP